MITKDQICNQSTINIFTDASILQIKHGSHIDHYVGCPGIVVYRGDRLVDAKYKILAKTTNNYCELYAILLAIQYARVHAFHKSNLKINIFSDSKISIFGLREWIFKWIANHHNGVLYGSSGPVSNQDLIIRIIWNILLDNIPVKLYHVRGHHDHDTFKEMISFRKSFRQENHIYDMVEDTLLQFLISGNSEVDNLTRSQLSDTRQVQRSYEDLKLQSPFHIDTKSIVPILDMHKYASLIK